MIQREVHSKELFKNISLPANYDPPIIVACELKTPENIGNIMRLADNIGCKKLLLITSGVENRTSKIRRTASSSFDAIDWEYCKISELNQKIPEDYTWVAVETSSDSENIYKTNMPEKIAFIVGNEISGIDHIILNQCHKIVHIPVYGKNTSLNVSHALAVALFEWQRRIVGL
ncbi:MAG TPA: TrmH family RNA methyltransferase [Bacteroidales bacterium]|nr:TrmH family RNA methyltransferase [Bacteroidales bacterium]